MEMNGKQDSAPTPMAVENESRESVAVIGGGPGAMFFCHALEVQRNELMKKGQDVSGFPIVKCFERSQGPGGVWRSDRSHDDEHNAEDHSFIEEKKEEDIFQKDSTARDTHEAKKMKLNGVEQESSLDSSTVDPTDKTPNMYSALWTNGPKEAFEFCDYTFQDHFGNVRMPTFLPRKHVLEYIIGRCTKNCPNFFEKYFSFGTSVVNVKYLDEEKNESSSQHSINNKFRVHTRNTTTGVEEINIFDKCIWAGGLNGIPYTPSKLVNLFKDGGFKGSLVHSSDTTNFKSDVENKRVLIVGGGYSAEDLALMAIKEGVSRIYCTYRGDTEKEMSWTTRWPYDKVEVLKETTILKVEGNTVTLEPVYMDYIKGEYTQYEEEEYETTTIEDIDTVIFCTGYRPNLNMLDQALRDAYDGDDDSDWGIAVPKDWRMEKNAAVDSILGKDYGHIKPSKSIYPCDDFSNCYYDLYQGTILIENPNMMYFMSEFSNTPLLETDINAWLLARFVSGQKALPSEEEMEDENYQMVLDCMQNCHLRYKIDRKFNKKIDKVIDEGMTKEQEALWEAEEAKVERYQYLLLGRKMNHAGYPVRILSEDDKTFTEFGEKVINLDEIDARHRMHEYTQGTNEDKQKSHQLPPGWMTFRDDPDAENYVSLYTGIKACPLPKPWFELNEDDKLW